MKRLQILIIEDDKSWRAEIIRLLNAKHHIIQIARNYAQAHASLAKSRFDLLLVDINLGPESKNQDGISILKEAFKMGTPTMVITSYGTREIIEKANIYDAVRFFHKSRFEPNELMQSIEEISKSSFHKPTNSEEGELAELLRKLIAGDDIK